MANEPLWARTPKHKKTVVATSRGWVVESTGELLVSVKGLDQKLKQLHSTPTVIEEQSRVNSQPLSGLDTTNVVIEGNVETPVVVPNAVIVENPIEVAEVKGPTVVEETTGPVVVQDTILVKVDSNDKDVIENVLSLKEDDASATEDNTSVEPPKDAEAEVIVVPPQAEFVAEQPVKRKPGRPKKVVKE